MATIVNMHQAKTELSKLVERALAGEEVVLARAGKPVVRLVPIRTERKPGFLKGRIFVGPDFDAPLSLIDPLREEAPTRPERKPGRLKGQIIVGPNFDEPLSEEILREFYGPIEPAEEV